MALIEHALVVDLLEGPPFGFDVIVVVGDIGMFHVDPVTDLVGHLLPFVQILPHTFLALADEGLDAVGFDLLLAVKTKDFLHFKFDWQTVGIPAGLAGDGLALHGLIAGEEILDDAGLDVTDVRFAVGGGWAVKEGEMFLAVLMVGKGLVDNILFLPELDDLTFALDELHVSCHFAVHRCASCSVSWAHKNVPGIAWDGIDSAVPPKLTASAVLSLQGNLRALYREHPDRSTLVRSAALRGDSYRRSTAGLSLSPAR